MQFPYFYNINTQKAILFVPLWIIASKTSSTVARIEIIELEFCTIAKFLLRGDEKTIKTVQAAKHSRNAAK